MDFFDLAQGFVECATRENRASVLGGEFQIVLERMGHRYFACCSHVDPVRPPLGTIVLHNYPSSWAREFYERQLWQIDPVLMHAEHTLLPFFWDSDSFQSTVSEMQRDILAQAASRGIARGYTIPIHLPWIPGAPRASCSVVPDSQSIDVRSYFTIQVMAVYLYSAAVREHQSAIDTNALLALTARERQCLELAAQGKSDWAIGQILNISEHVVHHTMEKAKRRLGVATRVQAVVCALRGRQISFGDTVRADTKKR